MVRWFVCFVIIILLGGCVQEAPVAEKPNIIEIPKPKYLDVELAESKSGRPINNLPRDIVFIGKLNEQAKDTLNRISKDEYYAEYRGELLPLRVFAWDFNGYEVPNECYLLCDKGITMDVLNEISENTDFYQVYRLVVRDGLSLAVHSIAHPWSQDDSPLITLDEAYLNPLFVCTDVDSSFKDMFILNENMKNEIFVNYSGDEQTLDQFKNECMHDDMIYDSIKKWSDRRDTAISLDIEPDFFDFMIKQWNDYLTDMHDAGKTKVCVPAGDNLLQIKPQPNDRVFPLLEFATKCVVARRLYRIKELGLPYYNYPIRENYMLPYFYIGNWRVISSLGNPEDMGYSFHYDLYRIEE